METRPDPSKAQGIWLKKWIDRCRMRKMRGGLEKEPRDLARLVVSDCRKAT
jgi:hypothetical protein